MTQAGRVGLHPEAKTRVTENVLRQAHQASVWLGESVSGLLPQTLTCHHQHHPSLTSPLTSLTQTPVGQHEAECQAAATEHGMSVINTVTHARTHIRLEGIFKLQQDEINTCKMSSQGQCFTFKKVPQIQLYQKHTFKHSGVFFLHFAKI